MSLVLDLSKKLSKRIISNLIHEKKQLKFFTENEYFPGKTESDKEGEIFYYKTQLLHKFFNKNNKGK